MGYARQPGPCGDYELFADPNVTAWAIATGLMEPAPTVPAGAHDVHFDTEEDQHIGVPGDEHFDWDE